MEVQPDAYSRDGHPVKIVNRSTEDGVEFAWVKYLDGHLPYAVGGRVAGTEDDPIWEHRVKDGQVWANNADYGDPSKAIIEKGLRDGPLQPGPTRKVWKQMTTGKIHRRETCGINRRTRYFHAPYNMTEADLAQADLCQKCWSGHEPNPADFQTDAEWQRRDDLITKALGIAPGETLTIDITDAPTGAEGGTTMEATATITAEALVDGSDLPLDVERPDKAPYARIRANGKTLGYADDRKDGFLLSIATKDMEGCPKRFWAFVTPRQDGKRRQMHVTTKNAKGARALLEWLAKQSA